MYHSGSDPPSRRSVPEKLRLRRRDLCHCPLPVATRLMTFQSSGLTSVTKPLQKFEHEQDLFGIADSNDLISAPGFLRFTTMTSSKAPSTALFSVFTSITRKETTRSAVKR
ncbi:hypothetical protein Bca4012_071463 [Brassica carinata]|uniref:Uncharacterized protein n=1 Tax=Brassica carinata TaxID=52824 RepID=A0A8X7U7H9_BRACI|nr:hypothetical protein Bca52824_063715 [Brassica carinata]